MLGNKNALTLAFFRLQTEKSTLLTAALPRGTQESDEREENTDIWPTTWQRSLSKPAQGLANFLEKARQEILSVLQATESLLQLLYSAILGQKHL